MGQPRQRPQQGLRRHPPLQTQPRRLYPSLPTQASSTVTGASAEGAKPVEPVEDINANSKEDPRDLRSYMKTWKTPFTANDNTFWAPPKELIHMTYEERRDYYRRIVRKRLQVDLAVLLDVSRLNDLLRPLLVHSGHQPCTQLFGGKGMGDSDTLSLGNAYMYEKPENLPVMFESWTDEELSHPIDSTKFLMVDLVQSRGWDGPKSRAKVLQSSKFMDEWSGSPSTSALHDLGQPMPISPGLDDDEDVTTDSHYAPPQARRRVVKKPRSQARQPIAISEVEEDDVDEQLPRYSSQPPVAGPSRPVAGPSRHAASIPAPRTGVSLAMHDVRDTSMPPPARHQSQMQQAGSSRGPASNSFPAVRQVNPFQPNMAIPPSPFYPQAMPDFAALFAQWMQTQAGAFASQGHISQPPSHPARPQDPTVTEDDYDMH
ncbi:hypothetical protein BKA70DRAFT_1450525 [Coprinopsis sp. MPI-PUGE-AT-0042]|nr:hypothetical protein BKA70DRAFT_1450525 [Coprinopsis sp. MPI-PUGE-AT-0042]